MDERTDFKTALWDAIHRYVRSCGGDPGKPVYGNTPRQMAVTDIERLIEQNRARPPHTGIDDPGDVGTHRAIDGWEPPLEREPAANYGRLEAILRDMGSMPVEPSPGWQQRVLSAINRARTDEDGTLGASPETEPAR